MGKALNEFAWSGQDQEAAGIDVQTADGHPAAAGSLRQAVENADAALRVVAGNDFAFLFVVEDDARQAVCPFEFDDAAFDGNVIVGRDFFTQLGYASVDRYPAVADPFFHFSTWADAGSGQDFLQALGFEAWKVAATFFQIAGVLHDFLVRVADNQFFGFGGTLFWGGILSFGAVWNFLAVRFAWCFALVIWTFFIGKGFGRFGRFFGSRWYAVAPLAFAGRLFGHDFS